MRKTSLFICSLMALLLTACSSDISVQNDTQHSGKTVPLTITATKTGSDMTRTSYAESEGAVAATWEATDKLVVVLDGTETELSLTSGEGTSTATFTGELEYDVTKPSASTQLTIYVKNANITINDADGSYTYADGVLTSQSGTLNGAAALNVYKAEPLYGNGTISDVTFTPNMSLVKFRVTVPEGVPEGTSATLSYSYMADAVTTVVTAPFTTAANPATSDVWFAIPAGTYSTQTLTVTAEGYNIIPVTLVDSEGSTTLTAATAYATAQEFDMKVPVPLTIEAIAAGTITITNKNSLTIEYSKDNENWSQASDNPITIDVAAGDCVRLRGNNESYTTVYYYSGEPVEAGTKNKCTSIGCSSDCYVYGNVMSLVSAENYDGLTTLTGSLACLFNGNTHIKNHPSKELELPATTLSSACYFAMFKGCTGLTAIPSLPASVVSEYGYMEMFENCTGLTEIPVLTATSLSTYSYNAMFLGCTSLTKIGGFATTSLANCCYRQMFMGCTSLETVATDLLPLTQLEAGCYLGMFNGCTALKTVPTLPATRMADYCYEGMFNGCTSLKTAPELPATELAERCYSDMFFGCTALETPPSLPGELAWKSCYRRMFQGCTAIKTAPTIALTRLNERCCYQMFMGCTSLESVVLPARRLQNTSDNITWAYVPYAYYKMFSGCTNLKYVKAMFTDAPITNAAGSSVTTNWLQDVAATGTFVMNSSAEWSADDYRSANGIPAGWTVETATE